MSNLMLFLLIAAGTFSGFLAGAFYLIRFARKRKGSGSGATPTSSAANNGVTTEQVGELQEMADKLAADSSRLRDHTHGLASRLEHLQQLRRKEEER